MSISRTLILAVVCVMASAQVVSAAEYVPGEIIVKYKAGAQRDRMMMNMLYNANGVTKVHRFRGMMKGFEQLVLNESIKVEDAIAALNQSPVVEYAQPNYILRVTPVQEIAEEPPYEKFPCIAPGIPFPPGCTDEPAVPPTKPDLQDAPAELNPPVADPKLYQAYGLTKIGAVDAWKDYRGSKDMIVAVIDTGIDYNHEDLSANVWRKTVDGKVIVGHDFVHNDDLPFDDQGHGTHTSGTVGAVGGNGKGVSGVNQKVSIMGVKFLSAEGSGTTADAIRSIDFAIENGAKVLSNSWGGPADEENPILLEAVQRSEAKGVLFIAAAGNEGKNNDTQDASYPAAFTTDNMIAVAATDKNDATPSWSNYGKNTVHLAAPGVGVYSTLPGNQYKSESGTSMACPHVAGAAALLWSKNPSWDYKKVKQVLLSSVDKVAGLESKTITGGRLNILKALRYRD
jgi:subtilisin family serine protease